jgi:alanyl-tRNA synthetase
VPAERIFAMSAKDNFWAMGDTGPCGPCSEIFYDLGVAASETGEDKPFPQDDQRYVEVWNLVFMQFDRSSDGVLTPLPKPSIDTGMGLERIACVLQGKLSNYESDLFTPLLKRAVELTGFDGGTDKTAGLSTASAKNADSGRDDNVVGVKEAAAPSALSSRPERDSSIVARSGETRNFSSAEIEALAVSDEKGAASLRIIADHARAATFLISDGVTPANEGRGYVLRKILRRGIRHGRLLGQEKPFMHEMVFAVRDEMVAAYPELRETADRVSKVVLAEEEQFARVLEYGSRRLQWATEGKASIGEYPDETILRQYPVRLGENDAEHVARVRRERHILTGQEAFSLYETYGLPVDFIQDAARDAGLEFDMEGFERAKEDEQARARASWKGGSQKSAAPVYRELAKTEFEGYTALRVDGAKVLALVKDGVGVAELKPGETGEVVLDATSFYADSGGQVGDVGWLYSGDHNTVVAEVTGCKKPVQGVFAHSVMAKQTIAVGVTVDTVVDAENRAATMRNHTGTHLLHAALREVLGTHVKQAGSLVDRARLRFDFSHFAGVADEELAEVESIVNAQVLANTPVQTMVDVPIDVAVHELGAMALFGEKYGERVRVVKIGDFSTELCGGTHTGATGEIGLIKITAESAVASGTRRVEAVTGTGSLGLFRRDADVARVASYLVGTGDVTGEALRARVAAQDEEMRKLRREVESLRMKSASAATAGAAGNAVEVKGVKVLAQRVDALDKAQMRNLVDELRGKLGSGVVVLGAATAEGKVSLIVGVTKDLTGRVQAGKIVGALAAQVGGKGGGRPDLAEAGGSDILALNRTLAGAKDVVAELLG